MKSVFGFFFILITFSVQSQIIRRDTKDPLYRVDTTSFTKSTKVKLSGKTHYTDYKIISIKNDTTVIDTTLTIKKEYIFNFLRKDIFGLMPFHNQGQTFTRLGYQFRNQSLTPFLGANAKHFNYYNIKDIYYYHVPTPTSEAMYRAGLEQGQVLDFMITMNTSPQFNFSLAYEGMRSLGKYRSALSSHGNFRSSGIYTSKNKKYNAKFHYYLYDLSNQENGGITEESKTFFEENDDNYKDRGRLEVNFTDATSLLKGNRLFLEHSYSFFPSKIQKKESDSISVEIDSLALKKKTTLKNNKKKYPFEHKNPKKKIKTGIKKTSKSVSTSPSSTKPKNNFFKNLDKFHFSMGHTFLYESKRYYFEQTAANRFFGDALSTSIADKATHNKTTNQLYVSSTLPFIGNIKGFAKYLNYNYYFNGVLNIDDKTIPNNLKGNALIVGGKWDIYFKKIHLKTEVSNIINNTITGNKLKVMVTYRKPFFFNTSGFIDFTNKSPDLNKLLYQSSYKKYNWKNDFKNENIKVVGSNFVSRWGAIHLDYTLIHNYTYFNINSQPEQAGTPVGNIKLKVLNEFRWRKIRLANTLMYQQVTSGDEFFRVPKFTTRNTLYFQDGVFKGDPLLLQVGVTFRYFTKYKMNAFNPLMNEFYLQNNQEIGDYPVFDFFANGRIRNVRLFFKVENFTSSFTGRKYYSAPYHPYRDLVVRFGLVWNWFI